MSTKKTFVTLACAVALFSIVNASSTFAEDATASPDAVVTTTKPSEATVPNTDTVDTGKKETETPVVPVPSKDENTTPTVPEVPTVPSTEETKPSKEETKPSTEETKPSDVKPETGKEEAKPSTEDKKDEGKNLGEDKKDNTNLPIVDPTLPNTKPIETNKGTVTGTENGKVIIKDATTGQERKVAPEELGGKVEKDGTVTIKGKDGKLTRLPHTGVEESIPMAVAGITMLTTGFGLLKRPRKKA